MEEKKTFWWLEKILFKIHFRKFSKCYYMKRNHCKSITQYQIFVKSIFKMKISIILFLFSHYYFLFIWKMNFSTTANGLMVNWPKFRKLHSKMERSKAFGEFIHLTTLVCVKMWLERKIFEMKFSISKRILSKNSFWIVSEKKILFNVLTVKHGHKLWNCSVQREWNFIFSSSYMYVTTLISFVEKWGGKKRAERAFAIPVHLWLLSTQSLNAEFSIIE